MIHAPIRAVSLTLRTHYDAPNPVFVADVVAGMNDINTFIVSIRIKRNRVELIAEAAVLQETMLARGPWPKLRQVKSPKPLIIGTIYIFNIQGSLGTFTF